MNPPDFTLFDYIMIALSITACCFWASVRSDNKRWKHKSTRFPYISKGD